MSELLTVNDLKAECARHDVTQGELAAALGITAPQLSAIYTNGIQASQEYLQRCIDKTREIARNRIPASAGTQRPA